MSSVIRYVELLSSLWPSTTPPGTATKPTTTMGTTTTASFSMLPEPALVAILAAAFRSGCGFDFVSLVCTCRCFADLAASPTSSLWYVLLEQYNNDNGVETSECQNSGDSNWNGNGMAVTPRDVLRRLVERPVWVPRRPGYLFTFGRGSRFRLGKQSEDTSSPVSPLGNTKVIMMGAGQYHMVVATTERQLFLWGDLDIDFKGDAPKDVSSLLPSTFKWPPRHISCSHHSFGLIDSNQKAFCSTRGPLSIIQLSVSNVKQLELRLFHIVILTEGGIVWQTNEGTYENMLQVTTGVKSLGTGAWGTVTLIMKSGGAQILAEGGQTFSHSLRDGERVLRAADGNIPSLWLTSQSLMEVHPSNPDHDMTYFRFPRHIDALCKVCAGADYCEPMQHHYAALTRDGDVFTGGSAPASSVVSVQKLCRGFHLGHASTL
ncbi:hypothetical protein Pelo_5384 [Pelomyxa schiedti]|nr:hypothetical protein Pelo_5384 [Pelomyxa schiedti]